MYWWHKRLPHLFPNLRAKIETHAVGKSNNSTKTKVTLQVHEWKLSIQTMKWAGTRSGVIIATSHNDNCDWIHPTADNSQQSSFPVSGMIWSNPTNKHKCHCPFWMSNMTVLSNISSHVLIGMVKFQSYIWLFRSTVALPNFEELQLAIACLRVLAWGGKNQRVGGESASVVAQQMKDWLLPWQARPLPHSPSLTHILRNTEL